MGTFHPIIFSSPFFVRSGPTLLNITKANNSRLSFFSDFSYELTFRVTLEFRSRENRQHVRRRRVLREFESRDPEGPFQKFRQLTKRKILV